MLKKQTIWLLTMLSLMIVLSVYYMTSDKDDLAYIDEGQTEETTKETTDEEASVTDIKNEANQDELFTTIRMEIQNERSMKKDRLKEIVASSSATTVEKNEALDNINEMDELTTKESILQDTILSASPEYQDVLVRHDEDKVHIHVKVDKLSSEEVVNIMQMVKDEFGEIPVDVNFQPSKG